MTAENKDSESFYALISNACPVLANDLNLTRFTVAKFTVDFRHVAMLTTPAQYQEVKNGFSQTDAGLTVYRATATKKCGELKIKFKERRSAEVFVKLFNKLRWENKAMKAQLQELPETTTAASSATTTTGEATEQTK